MGEIARLFARAALALAITCILITGAVYGVGKAAPASAGMIYFSLDSTASSARHIYLFDPLRLARYNLSVHQGVITDLLPAPDGQRFAFRGNTGDSAEVRIFDFDTTRVTSIYNQPQVASLLLNLRIYAWSPSGRYLAFSSNGRLFKYDFSTGEASPLVNEERGNILNDESPAWSPDETRIAFTSASRQTDFWQIYLVNADGSEMRRVTRTDVCAFYRPRWSPISENLLALDGACDLISDVFLLDVDTQRLRSLADLAVSAWSPVWSPDGRKILFVAGTTSQNRSVYVFDVDESEARRLIDGSVALWSPDGSHILFSAANGDLYSIQEDGSDLRQLTFYNGSPFIYPLAWSR